MRLPPATSSVVPPPFSVIKVSLKIVRLSDGLRLIQKGGNCRSKRRGRVHLSRLCGNL